MPFSVLMIFIISFIIFCVTFLLSLSSNVFIDALFRSFIVFLLSIASFSFILWFVQYIQKQANEDTKFQRTSLQTEQNLKMAESDETGKGGHIDFQTPEDADEQFIPFQPGKVDDQEN